MAGDVTRIARHDGWLLARMLRDPAGAAKLDPDAWSALVSIARAERLTATLAARLEPYSLPAPVARLLADARDATAQEQVAALWEAEVARRVLAPISPVILLKGSAYVAAGLAAAVGRAVGDLDILVPRALLGAVETALLGAGWEWVKPDPYDDLYYRRWMHELPPLIHRDRDRMIDVHHTILPLTAQPRPDPDALIDAAVALDDGLRVLAPNDMIIHAAAHLLADGNLDGGMRNLWDIHCLVRQFGTGGLAARAGRHALERPVLRACRLAALLYGDGDDSELLRSTVLERLCLARLTARDGWGRSTRPLLQSGFYVRSHLLRMPLPLLARHLSVKARRAWPRRPRA